MIEDGIQFNLPKNRSSVIKVIGVGGGGSNAVNHMTRVGVNGVDFIVCNTDAQALYHSPVVNKVQLGASLTEGLGAGADPEIGQRAAQESIAEITKMLENGTKMCFVTAGMGGGTGTGAAPVIAKAAKDMGILTVGIITSPFSFEGNIRASQAQQGITEMRAAVDSLIVINNDKLRQVYGDLGFRNAFSKADEVLAGAAKGIAEVITNHYTQNIDLRDAKTVLENSGSALFGTGDAEGENRASAAVSAALDSPLLNDNHIKGAKNILLLITSGEGQHEITIDEIGEITDHIQREAGGTANVIMGIGGQPEEGSKISCTIIATGFPTGTPVLPNEKPEVVVHTLDEEKIEAPLSAPAPAPVAETPAHEAAPQERVVLELGEEVEETEAQLGKKLVTTEAEEEHVPEVEAVEETSIEAPIEEVAAVAPEETAAPKENFAPEAPAFELEETASEEADHIPQEVILDEQEDAFEAELATMKQEEEAINAAHLNEVPVEEDPRAGFPQRPQEDESIFETSLSDQASDDEQPTMHVLEWDMDEEDTLEEATSSAALTEEPIVEEPIAETTEISAAEEQTDAPQNEGGLEVPSWDLFSQAVDPEEEEIELIIVDEDDSQEEPTPALPTVNTEFEQPAPAPMERPQGMVAPKSEELPEEINAPIDTTPEQPVSVTTSSFSLEDIDGDGFTLNLEEIEEFEASNASQVVAEERNDAPSYDAFELSLNELPSLQKKAQQESIEGSFKVPEPEFNTPEVAMEDEEVAEEKVALNFSVKTVEEPKAPEQEESTTVAEDLDRPISAVKASNAGAFPKKIQDRISRLNAFQYQFKTTKGVQDAERIPAYMRQGMEVDVEPKSGEQPSNIGVDAQGNLRTNNSFLHDNVD